MPTHCKNCGGKLPHWDDISAAMETMIAVASDDKPFNRQAAELITSLHNQWLEAQKPVSLKLITANEALTQASRRLTAANEELNAAERAYRIASELVESLERIGSVPQRPGGGK
jgi:hypothetical protein